MNENNKLYIVIPAYNESMNIERCVNDWYPIVEKISQEGEALLVVINDGSKDDTYEILLKLAAEWPLLIPLTKDNGGHGSAVLLGYRYAIDNKADYVFQTDSDGQTDPNEFWDFWELRNEYDTIIGVRVKRGDGIGRKIIENTVCVVLRVIFGVKVPDANAPFRLMRTSVLQKYISKLPENFNIPNIMFTTYFVYHKEKVKFVPITFRSRQGGANSINIKKILKIGWKAIVDFCKLRKQINKGIDI